MIPIRTVDDHLLRTFAAVPVGQSVVVDVPLETGGAIRQLGFEVTSVHTHSRSDGARSLHHWGAVVLVDVTWREAIGTAIAISSFVRDGGWVFVGVAGAVGDLDAEDPNLVLRDMIGAYPLAIAKQVEIATGESDTSISAIIRRVTETTPR